MFFGFLKWLQLLGVDEFWCFVGTCVIVGPTLVFSVLVTILAVFCNIWLQFEGSYSNLEVFKHCTAV